MNRLKQASRWLTRYRAARYVLYVFVYFLCVPVFYLFALVFGALCAVVESSKETTEGLIHEYKTLAHILRKERENEVTK